MRIDGETGHVLGAAQAWERLLGVRTERDAGQAGLVRGKDGTWRWEHDASPEAEHLAELYVPLCLGGPRHVFAQLGQSMDGFIATRTGDAVYVTGEEDRLHLHRLRALADAVVVGAGTAIADDPRLTVRACSGSNPVRVLLDHRGRVLRRRRLFTDGSAPTLWILAEGRRTAEHAIDGVEVIEVPGGENGFEPGRLLDVLAERGLGRVLIEGGGVTVSRFLHAKVLQRLYVTIAPVLVGDGVPGLRFPGPARMSEALRAPSRRFVLGEDLLFELDLRAGEVPEDEYSGTGQARDEGEHAVHHGDGDPLGRS
ncbi:riboflavin-specific deaminase-like protein [Actinoallomurus bryophytorum]|uniref:Riboflavin-specific deaminase-like protein n=1 Tax=Actinoallomurus bryophytorum TaxID=1490222 RepID=A0A543CPV9_9ACTN|nr:riboflavin-specific deaminase-like protein [Actinoallomurus bryophytorum]